MSNIFNGFFDNLVSGTLNPKGNLADYRHASRTFNANQFRLAPKVKFLYHVFFEFSPNTMDKILLTWKDRHTLESGLMVKSVKLPAMEIDIETKKKYNRTKHVQTGIRYNAIDMTFHDDNLGMMTGMLEAYFKYYYADGWKDVVSTFYNKNFPGASSGKGAASIYNPMAEFEELSGAMRLGDNTYKNAAMNKTLHGLNTGFENPFFKSIQISQMTRHTYTQFQIINPILSGWDFGDASSNDNTVNELRATFNYESVWIERGATQSGKGLSGTSPKGFGNLTHYDVTPSPNSIYGGGGVSLKSIIGGAGDIINSFTGGGDGGGDGLNELFDYTKGGVKKSPNILGAIIGGANILKNVGKLSQAGIEQEVGGMINQGLGGLYDNVVSGEGGFFGDD